MKTTTVGKMAEKLAAEHLVCLGYKIIDQNWRNRFCEIDLIAQKRKVIYFVEVKYRSADRQGSGIDYITAKKVTQMSFASEFWCADNSYSGERRLLGVEVFRDGTTMRVESVVEII